MLALFEYSSLIVNYQYFKTYLNPTFLCLFYLFRTVFLPLQCALGSKRAKGLQSGY